MLQYPSNLNTNFYLRKMSPKDADGIANSPDPDQTQPSSAIDTKSCVKKSVRWVSDQVREIS